MIGDKANFLDIEGDYMHIKEEFINEMKLQGSKVQRTINEKTDSAIYTIKAKLQVLEGTVITNNDLFLSASTESQVVIK